MRGKDVYNPDAGKQPLPDPDEYFGFETRGDVKLLVNYDVPGFTALVEVYDEDPMVEGTSVKKKEWRLYSKLIRITTESMRGK